jgi:hypothetical protein
MRIFCSDFVFCTIKILGKNFYLIIVGGATIVSREAKNFLSFKSYMTFLYLLIINFPNFDPSTATGMTFCVNLEPKCQNVFPLVSDQDQAESSLA